jgi:hypothetical protein
MPKGFYPKSKTHRIKIGRSLSKIRSGDKNPFFGRKHSLVSKERMSKTHSGENNPAWLGGISFNPYTSEFTRKLKLEIRTRDNFKCCLCGRTEREELEEFNRVLSVNHIDFNKHNCKKKNLNTLCLRCNVKINRERDYWTDFFQQNYNK